MTKEEKRNECKKLLAFIYAEWGKVIDDQLVTFWLINLRGVNKTHAWKAAQKLVKAKTFGEPKLQDFQACLDEVLAEWRETLPKKMIYNPHTGTRWEIQYPAAPQSPQLDLIHQLPCFKDRRLPTDSD